MRMNEKRKDGGAIWQDPDEAPELTDEFFARATLHDGAKIIRRGRPVGAARKAQVTLRLDADVIEFFRGTGRRYQSRINAALRDYVDAQKKAV